LAASDDLERQRAVPESRVSTPAGPHGLTEVLLVAKACP